MCYVLCAIFARNEKVVTSVEIRNKMHLYLVSCISVKCVVIFFASQVELRVPRYCKIKFLVQNWFVIKKIITYF